MTFMTYFSIIYESTLPQLTLSTDSQLNEFLLIIFYLSFFTNRRSVVSYQSIIFSGSHQFRISVSDIKMSFVGTLYKGLAKRTSTFVLAIAVSAFAFERGLNLRSRVRSPSLNPGTIKSVASIIKVMTSS